MRHPWGCAMCSVFTASCLIEPSWGWGLQDSSPGRWTGPIPPKGSPVPCCILELSLSAYTVVPSHRYGGASGGPLTDWVWRQRERDDNGSAAHFPNLARCCSSRLMCDHGKHTQALPQMFAVAGALGLSSEINQRPFIECLLHLGHI